MQSVYLEFGRKVVGDTLEQVSKNVFAKPIAKVQTENIKTQHRHPIKWNYPNACECYEMLQLKS